ncbi:MAG: DegV family protein [Candidatus Neomarinimicrobiota bacterium]
MKIKYIDGKRFSLGIRAGTRRVVDHQDYLNEINVFPVPDADTGTNMASTLRTVVENMQESTSTDIDASSKQIADSALEGARGNSGVILAQFFYGLYKGLGKSKKIDTEQFAKAAKSAKEHAYDALSKPKEGTILTVIKDWAENVHENSKTIRDFEELLGRSLEVAKRSLENTRYKLEALKSAGVVDAGAQGFVYLLEGITHFIRRGRVKDLAQPDNPKTGSVAATEILPEDITFRFCTECLIEGKNIDIAEIRSKIESMGDSIVVAGSPEKIRLHIHSNEPAKVFAIVRKYGDLLQQKADDMLKQFTISHSTHPSIAIVADSACDLPQDIIDKLGIFIIPVRVSFGNSIYIDKVTITPEYFYQMLDTEPHHPKTSQPPPIDFINAYSFLLSHYDSIISIHIPEPASGTYQNALNAAKNFPDKKITIIDAKALSITEGFVVERAAELVHAGKTHDEVVAEIKKFTSRTQVFVSIPSLKYLMRSGRVSKAKGLFAKYLNIKPILKLDERGMPVHCSKSFSNIGAVKKVLKFAMTLAKEKKNPRFVVAHANNLKIARFLRRKLFREFGINDINILPIAPVLGAHVGNGAAAIGLSWSE